MRRHVKRCCFSKKNLTQKVRHQSEAQNLLVGYFGPDDPLRTSGVLSSLTADEISLVAKKDRTICEVGRRYAKSHRDKHLVAVAKRQMRRLARLLIESRKLENNPNLTLFSLLDPAKFKTLVNSTRIIAEYDLVTKSFASPSLAMQMGTLIKKALSAAYSMEIQRDVNSSKIKNLEAIKCLINDEWASEVSTEANQNLQVNRFNKPTLLPAAESIAVSKQFSFFHVETKWFTIITYFISLKNYGLMESAKKNLTSSN